MAARSSRERERWRLTRDRGRHAQSSAAVIAACIVAMTSLGAHDASAALSLTTTAAPTFAVVLNGADQAPTYALPLTATDSTGLGLGWKLTITSTPFSTGGGTPRSLPATAASVTSVASTCAVGPCTDPVNLVGTPVAIPAGTTPPPAVKFFSAQAGSGIGQFTVTATVTVNVPANAYAGTYASTLTLAISAGP